jgi:hypothetical protein
MTIYKCEKCKHQFDRKSTYNNHLTRKNSCKLNDNVDNECFYCNKKFSKLSNLNKHLKICKEKLIEDDNQAQIEELKKMFERKFEEQQKEILKTQIDNQELKKKVEELSHLTETNQMTEGRLPSGNITVTENSHNNNNNNNTTNNIINIYNAGKEDLSRLSKEDTIKICTSGTYYPIVAAEVIHCNKNYPEFQNFLISNLRSATGLVYANDGWISKTHDELLTSLMRIDKKHVSSLIKDLKVDDKYKVKLESTRDEIDTNESKEHQKPKIKAALYNASKMIVKNKKVKEKTLLEE